MARPPGPGRSAPGPTNERRSWKRSSGAERGVVRRAGGVSPRPARVGSIVLHPRERRQPGAGAFRVGRRLEAGLRHLLDEPALHVEQLDQLALADAPRALRAGLVGAET